MFLIITTSTWPFRERISLGKLDFVQYSLWTLYLRKYLDLDLVGIQRILVILSCWCLKKVFVRPKICIIQRIKECITNESEEETKINNSQNRQINSQIGKEGEEYIILVGRIERTEVTMSSDNSLKSSSFESEINPIHATSSGEGPPIPSERRKAIEDLSKEELISMLYKLRTQAGLYALLV